MPFLLFRPIKMSREQTHKNVEREHKICWCERSLIFPYAKWLYVSLRFRAHATVSARPAVSLRVKLRPS